MSTINSLQNNQDNQKHQIILDWLSSSDFPAQQSDFTSRRQNGTGEWLVNSPKFTDWLHMANQILYCPGLPGAGKTMMAAIIVDHLWKTFPDDDIGIAYIYCNYKRQESQKTTDLLAAILKQLVQKRLFFREPVLTLYERHFNRKTRPSLDEILDALYIISKSYIKIYVVVDALDECTEIDGTHSQLLTHLRDLHERTNTSLMVTSRFLPSVIEVLEGAQTLEVRAMMSISRNI